MAEEKPTLHVDTDWKKQAQEEKRRLAEEEAKRAKPAPSAPAGAAAPEMGAARAAAPGAQQASFSGLVQSLLTQVLFYLGDISPRGVEPQVNLDMAKFNIDMLAMLEEKTRGNVSDEEKSLLDRALYETRMRYVNVASQYATV